MEYYYHLPFFVCVFLQHIFSGSTLHSPLLRKPLEHKHSPPGQVMHMRADRDAAPGMPSPQQPPCAPARPACPSSVSPPGCYRAPGAVPLRLYTSSVQAEAAPAPPPVAPEVYARLPPRWCVPLAGVDSPGPTLAESLRRCSCSALPAPIVGSASCVGTAKAADGPYHCSALPLLCTLSPVIFGV